MTGIYRSPGEGLPGRGDTLAYTSKALPVFIDKMTDRSAARMLDVGPVCDENINFFGRRLKTIYICDLFFHLSNKAKKTTGSQPVWRQLDYSPETFDGILLWDLLDRLTEEDARKISRRCYDLLRPGGMVMICATAAMKRDPAVHAFVLKKDFRVTLRAQPHLSLPMMSHKNKDLLDMFVPLKSMQSFLFRNGLREILLRKE